MTNYATVEELKEKVTVPEWIEAQDLLDFATEKIRETVALLRYSYRLGSDGLPHDPATRASLARASVSQAAFWVSGRYNPVEGRFMPKDGEEEAAPIITRESQQGLSQDFLVTERTVALEEARKKGLAPLAALELRRNLRQGSAVVYW